jgi:hypothetical protein
LTNREGLIELSFVFFVGWLFTGILNRSKELIRLSLVPSGPGDGDLSVLVLYRPETPLASPTRRQSVVLDRDYFVCPLDRSRGAPLTATQRHLCPVVNKLRYNLAHARPDGSVAGLREPEKTQYCCESNKEKLWSYLSETLWRDPDLYGPMVGGRAFPIKLPFGFLEKYLTGIEPGRLDFGKLLEETFLWFAMAASEVIIGYPHVTPLVPIVFHEIDLLLYHTNGDFTPQPAEPEGGWEAHLSTQSACIMEFTIGHHADVAKPEGTGPAGELRQYGVLGKDVPKNKLMNFHAMRSYGFHSVRGYYFTVTGEANLGGPTLRSLRTTDCFTYYCLADSLRENIEQMVLSQDDAPIPVAKVREWHQHTIDWIEQAAREFRGTCQADGHI